MENGVIHEVTIAHQGTLTFRMDEEPRNPDGTTDYLTVTAELEGLRASRKIYDYGGWSGLLAFVEELAAHWRGWNGNKTFDSLEGDFRLSAKQTDTSGSPSNSRTSPGRAHGRPMENPPRIPMKN
jgi:hypothetical protein